MNEIRPAAVPALVIRRTYNAPRERVFAALTTVELLRRWFGPPGIDVGEVTFDARSGGRYRIAMKTPEGEEYNVGGLITEYRAPERLAYTFRWEEDDPKTERDTFVSIDFIDRGKQTEMVLTHAGLVSEDSREVHAGGWNGALNNIAALL